MSKTVYLLIMVLADTYPTTSSPTTVNSLETISDPGPLWVGSYPSYFTWKIHPLAVAFFRQGGPWMKGEKCVVLCSSRDNRTVPWVLDHVRRWWLRKWLHLSRRVALGF